MRAPYIVELGDALGRTTWDFETEQEAQAFAVGQRRDNRGRYGVHVARVYSREQYEAVILALHVRAARHAH